MKNCIIKKHYQSKRNPAVTQTVYLADFKGGKVVTGIWDEDPKQAFIFDRKSHASAICKGMKLDNLEIIEKMKNDLYIGNIMSVNKLDVFIKDAKRLSLDMQRTGKADFTFEKHVTSSNPIHKAYQEANAACEVFRLGKDKYFGSDFGTWQRDLIGKWGIF